MSTIGWTCQSFIPDLTEHRTTIHSSPILQYTILGQWNMDVRAGYAVVRLRLLPGSNDSIKNREAEILPIFTLKNLQVLDPFKSSVYMCMCRWSCCCLVLLYYSVIRVTMGVEYLVASFASEQGALG